MTGADATILAAVLTVGVVIMGGLVKMARAQGEFHGMVREFMVATLRRLDRLETKADCRDQRNENRRQNGMGV